MTWSIRARLTAWYSGVVVAVLAAAAIAVGSVQAQRGLHRLDGELGRLAMTVDALMQNEFGEGMDVAGAATEVSTEVASPGLSVIVSSPSGDPLAAWGESLPAAFNPRRSAVPGAPAATLSLRDARFRLVQRHVPGTRPYVISVLAPLAPLERDRAELGQALVAGVVVALLVAALGGWVVSRQALWPLTAMARQATAISDRSLAERLRAPNAYDELGRLAAAFNALLDRLSTSLVAQRQFMADASHQLRTPVSVLRTTAQVVLRQDGRDEREYRECLTIVAEQSARLSRLVNAMLLLSRAEAGGRPLSHELVYFDELVAECVRAVAMLASERGVRVAMSGATDVPFSGDDELLRDMIVNLLENSVRYTRAGTVVRVHLDRAADDGLVLTVCDQGHGIAPGDRERIFQRFVRLGNQADGAGLGLPMARWIAEAHGGTLTLKSSGPDGSCFAVMLPPRMGDAVLSRVARGEELQA